MQQKTAGVHAEDPVQRMQVAPNCHQKVNDWSCIFEQCQHRWLRCHSRPNSYWLWRGVVTAHILVWVQHPQWAVVI